MILFWVPARKARKQHYHCFWLELNFNPTNILFQTVSIWIIAKAAWKWNPRPFSSESIQSLTEITFHTMWIHFMSQTARKPHSDPFWFELAHNPTKMQELCLFKPSWSESLRKQPGNSIPAHADLNQTKDNRTYWSEYSLQCFGPFGCAMLARATSDSKSASAWLHLTGCTRDYILVKKTFPIMQAVRVKQFNVTALSTSHWACMA